MTKTDEQIRLEYRRDSIKEALEKLDAREANAGEPLAPEATPPTKREDLEAELKRVEAELSDVDAAAKAAERDQPTRAGNEGFTPTHEAPPPPPSAVGRDVDAPATPRDSGRVPRQ